MIKIDIVLDELDYGKIIEYIVPQVLNNLSEKDDKLNRFFSTLSNVNEMTNDMLKAALNTLPQQKKNELVVSMLEIYNEEIIKQMNKLMDKNQLSVNISQIKSQNI